MTDIKEVLLLWYTHFLMKKSVGSGINILLEPNEELAIELHKPTIRKFRKISLF